MFHRVDIKSTIEKREKEQISTLELTKIIIERNLTTIQGGCEKHLAACFVVNQEVSSLLL